MRPALVLTIAVILLAAILCFGIRQRAGAKSPQVADVGVAA